MPLEIEDIQDELQRLGEPFARAFAVFLRELHRDNGLPHGRAREVVEEIDMPLNELEQAEFDRLAGASHDAIELTDDTGPRFAGRRLRQVLKAKGMTQAALARQLKVSPAVVNRVLKNPDRSMVATLRKIAKALGVELYEIVDR